MTTYVSDLPKINEQKVIKNIRGYYSEVVHFLIEVNFLYLNCYVPVVFKFGIYHWYTFLINSLYSYTSGSVMDKDLGQIPHFLYLK